MAIQALIAGIVALLLTSCAAIPAPQSADLLIRNVSVLDPATGEVAGPRQVAIHRGRIVALLASGQRWAAAQVVDGSGGVVMPGFVDAHVHLREAPESALLDYLRAGITTVRDMNGRPHVLQWRDEIEDGRRLGPRIVAASPTIANISSPKEGYPTPKTGEQGRAVVDRFVREGYDFIKIYTFLPTSAFNGIMERARKHGVRVAGHAPLGVPFDNLVSSGLWSLEHGTGLAEAVATDATAALDEKDNRAVFQGIEVDPAKLRRRARQIAQAGVWQVPTMIYWEKVPPPAAARKPWENPEVRTLAHRSRMQIIRGLFEAGAPLAVGSDSDAGEHLEATAFWDELALMDEAGLPTAAVLKAATTDGARMLNLSDTGAVRIGAVADLVLLRCNPIQDVSCVRHPRAVISRGRLVPATR